MIAQVTNIKILDAYQALGWLAREDKVHLKPNKAKKQRPIVSLK